MKYVAWIAMALVTLVMVAGGASKLTGNEMALSSFETLGLPSWFAMFIGLAEIAGGLGIWLRRTSVLAALGIAVIMLGAIYYHVVHTPIEQAVPAFVVLLCCVLVISRRGGGVVG